MARGVFVTGTDTGVGKTVVSAALVMYLRRRPEQASLRSPSEALVRYWKPVQTGVESDDDTATVRRLARCQDRECVDVGVRLPRPLSPHLAARLAGSVITLEGIMAIFTAAQNEAAWVVEGAGGVLVPLNEADLMIDLIARLALPVVVVARSGLGTINHTLLTLAALRAHQVSVAGVIVNGLPNADNCDAICRYGRVPILGQLPLFEILTAEGLAGWASTNLDPERRLLGAMS